MSLARESRNERKLKAARRAQFRLKQTFERIDWEEESLLPELARWKGLAQLPAPPTDLDIDIAIDGNVALLPNRKPDV